MKKLFILLALACIMMSSCTNAPIKKENNKIDVVCTAFPQYDFARQIAGDAVNVHLLLPPGAEAHSYEPSPGDILTLQNADLLLMIGGESEHWAQHLLDGQEDNSIIVVRLADSVTRYTEEHTEGMEDSGHSHTHTGKCHHSEEELAYDEHIWTSPKNAINMCKTICDALCTADAKNATHYQKGYEEYSEVLSQLQESYMEATQNVKRRVLVFGDRFPLRYLTEDMGLEYYAAFPGCSSKTEPSAKTVAFLSRKVKEESIPVVFYMDYSDGRIAKTIATESSADAKRLYSCHSLSREDFENGETYVSLMERNLLSLKEALY